MKESHSTIKEFETFARVYKEHFVFVDEKIEVVSGKEISSGSLQYILGIPIERRKIRPNIEATMKEFTKGFNHKGKLKIRGSFKTMLFAIVSSMAINFGRIYRAKVA